MIKSPYQDLPLTQSVFFPAWPLLNIMHNAFLVPWLPHSQISIFQAKVEIKFQKKRLVKQFEIFLEYINASCPFIRQFPDSLLETAIKRINMHQQEIAGRIHKSEYGSHRHGKELDGGSISHLPSDRVLPRSNRAPRMAGPLSSNVQKTARLPAAAAELEPHGRMCGER